MKNEGTELSLATDFVGSTGPIERCLQLTALAGFTHIHWCHHWNDDFVYTEDQIDYTAEQLAENGLKLADTHGSNGNEKCWISVCENERRAGVELVKNRIEFTARLGGDCLVLHPPSSFQPAPNLEAQMSAMARSLDELEAFCRDRGVRLALENATRWADYQTCIIPVMEARPPEYLGFCYDSGHHNIDMIRDDRERAGKMRPETGSPIGFSPFTCTTITDLAINICCRSEARSTGTRWPAFWSGPTTPSR